MTVEPRAARPEELALLPAVEGQADRRFGAEHGPMPGPCDVGELRGALAVLVVGDPPIGFARLEALGDGVHLEQVSVLPERGHRGLGRALVEASCRWAADRGYPTITLMTYRDVAWNGPFYRSAGFGEVAPATTAEEALVRADAETMAPVGGLGQRVLMARPLTGRARRGGSTR